MALPTPDPHSIAITLLVTRIFPPREVVQATADAWHIKHALHTKRLLDLAAREVLGDNEPSTYRELVDKVEQITEMSKSDKGKIEKYVGSPLHELRDLPRIFSSVQDAYVKMENIAELYIEREDEGPTSQNRISFQSPLGVFSRKVYLRYKVLSFAEIQKVGEAVCDWCDATVPHVLRRLQKPTRKPLYRSPNIDDTIDERMATFQSYQDACHRGDYAVALHGINKFYNYRFPPSTKKMHQHALLNLASFHYATGGLERAKESIAEAIKIARAEGDKECLQHCVSLRNRLQAETQKSTTSIMTPGQPVHISDTGQDTKDATPLDELWSIKLRTDLGSSVPLAFNRIHRAIGRDGAIRSAQRDEALAVPAREGYEAAVSAPASTMVDDALLHGVSSAMWGLLGTDRLSSLHQSEVFACAQTSRDIDLGVTIARSQQLARSCRFDDALAILLEPDVSDGLSLAEYHKWSQALWDVLEVDARLRDDAAMADFIRSRRLPDSAYRQLGPGGPVRVLAHADEPVTFDFFGRDEDSGPRRTSDWLSGRLQDAKDLEGNTQAALPVLLSVVHTSAELQAWPAFRRATIMLAEALGTIDADLSLGTKSDGPDAIKMIHLAAKEVLGVWDQILRSDDQELIYTGAWILTRAHLTRLPESAEQTARHAGVAITAARRMRSRKRLEQVAMLQALMAHRLGDAEGRRTWSDCWADLQAGADTEEALTKHRLDLEQVDLSSFSLGLTSFDAASGRLELAQSVDAIITKLGVRIARGG